MNETDDDLIRELLHQMTEVPFSSDLEQRILAKAAMHLRDKQTWKRRVSRLAGKMATVAAGVIAAAGLIVAIVHRPTAQNGVSDSTAMKAAIISSQPQNAYGLSVAPLRVKELHIGQQKGYSAQSEVIALLSNESSHQITARDVFGVLAFSRSKAPSSIGDADWITFVNGPNTAHPILPHHTQIWAFYPVDAPSNHFALTEIPYLVFFSSDSLHATHSDTIWRVNPIKVTHAIITGHTAIHLLRTKGESVAVEADLTNPTKQALSLGQPFAIIWFDANPADSFMSYDAVRFISHIPSVNGVQKVLTPGESFHVTFHVIGSPYFKYQSAMMHIAIVNIP